MLELIQRGQDRGDIDATLPHARLLTAGEAVKAGRMTIEEAAQAMHHSFLRLLGVADPAAPGPSSGRPAQKRREAPGVPPAGRARHGPF